MIGKRGQVQSIVSRTRDLLFSAGRYYLNNYADSYRQDNLDIFLGNHRGSQDSKEHPQMTAAEYAERQQQLQRRQSFLNIHPAISSSRYSTRFAVNMTVYLQLAIRYWSPRQLKSWWQWTMAFMWLVLMSIWRVIIGTRMDWRGLRRPKSGDKCWDGDEVPIPISTS
jgi:hypothetical protein